MQQLAGRGVIKRLMFISKRFHTNEATLVRHLVQSGIEVEYVVHEIAHSEDHSVINPIVVGYAFPMGNAGDAQRLKQGLYPFKVLSQIKAFDPDLVVIKGFRRASLLLSIVLRLNGVRTLISVQNPLHDVPNRRTRFVQALSGPDVVTPVIGNPQMPRRRSALGPLRQAWHYMPFVAEAHPSASARDYFRDNRINILLVGKFVERKMLLEAVRVCSDLSVRNIEVAITVVGTVLDEEYHCEVLDLAARTPNVAVLTNVPYLRMAELYLRHDVFVLASVRERAAYSHLEAMACGLAVIVSSDNGTSHYVEDGVNGLVFDASNFEKELSIAVSSMVSSRTRIVSMGRSALARVEKNHKPDAVITLLENVVAE